MTAIEWTHGDDGAAGETWNLVTGCTRQSEGCFRCFIERQPPMRMSGRRFDGDHVGARLPIQLHPDRLTKPLRWRRPRRIFVNSMSDLFHPEVPEQLIARAWAVMALTPRHTFQILTKRHARMRSLLNSPQFYQQVRTSILNDIDHPVPVGDIERALHWCDPAERRAGLAPEPLPNVWLGISAENQRWADIRIPKLLTTQAAVRFVSAEPLLGPIDLRPYLEFDSVFESFALNTSAPLLDWVIVGGETGPDARPMQAEWARSLRDQCQQHRVPLFFKQAGTVLAAEWGATRKGNDPAEWPEHFPRQFPAGVPA